MAKSPSTAMTKLMPSISSTAPNVRRARPVRTSIPTTDTSRPSAAMMRDFSSDPPPIRPTAVSATSMRTQYSGGPKRSPNSESGTASSMRPATLIVPAMKDAIAAIPRAAPARPCRAS